MSDEQLTQIERKIDGLATGMAGLDGRLSKLDERLTGSVNVLTDSVTALDGRLSKLDERLTGSVTGLECSVTGLTDSVAKLKAGQDTLAAEVGKVAGNLETVSTKLGVQFEAMSNDVKLLAEGHGGIIQQMDRRFDEQRADIREIMAPLVLAIGSHTEDLADVRRIPRRPGRAPGARRAKRRRT